MKTPSSSKSPLVRIAPELAPLMPLFFAQCREDAAILADALAREDFPAVCRRAHSIKGAALNFGFEALAAMTFDIETSCEAFDVRAAADCAAQMAKYLEEVDYEPKR